MKKYRLYLIEYIKDNITRIDYIKANTVREAILKFEDWKLNQTSEIEIIEVKQSKVDLIDE